MKTMLQLKACHSNILLTGISKFHKVCLALLPSFHAKPFNNITKGFVFSLFYFLLLSSSSYAAKTSQLTILTSFPPDFYLTFQREFNLRYPNIQVNIRNKKTSAGLRHLQRKFNHNIDLFWASAPDAFDILQSNGLLESLPDIQFEFDFPEQLLNYPLKEKQGHYLGFALSGYGIMQNKAYLEKHQLSPPKSWLDLAKPEYYSHLALSSPSRSGTTHLMIEMILQRYGWEKGWQIILQMAGNVATITARSYGVPEGIEQGRFGLGLVIDFFAHKINSPNIAFSYATESSFLPASIALLKQSKNKADAKTFINFVLSQTGQTLLQQQNIARLPINPSLYQQGKQPINPFLLPLDSRQPTFSSALSIQRYDLVNHVFDHFITFQLKTLQRLWGKVYALEKHIETSDFKRKALGQLKQQLSSLPISQQHSQDPSIYNSLKSSSSTVVSGFLPQPLARFKQDWLKQLNRIELALEKL